MPSYLSEHRQTWLTCVPVTGHSKEAGIIDVTSWQVSTHRENGVLVEQHSGRPVEKKIRPVITQAGDRGCVALLMVLLLTKHKQISQQAATYLSWLHRGTLSQCRSPAGGAFKKKKNHVTLMGGRWGDPGLVQNCVS